MYSEDQPGGEASIGEFAEALDLEMTVLVDNGNASDNYPLDQAFPSAAYPRQFVVGVDGTVVYVNNRYEYDSLSAVLDQELKK